jgi:hypothetical protein
MAFAAVLPILMRGGIAAAGRRLMSSSIIAGIITGITHLFKTKLGLFLMTAMLWLGINWGTIKIIIEPAIDLLYGYAQGGMGGGPYAAAAMQWLGVMQFDRAITMVVSAIVSKNAVMQGRLFLFKKGFGAP